MKSIFDRRKFIKTVTVAGAGMGLAGSGVFTGGTNAEDPVPVGIIGLDTSHSVAFTRLINNPEGAEQTGFKVVAAFPYGSRTIESSYTRIPEITEEVKGMGVDIVDSIGELLDRVEVVLLETNDGNPRLEQALQVIEAGKRMFIDKPVAASLQDTISIMEASRQYDSPIFSTSSLRYINSAHEVRYENLIGEVMGAETYSPAVLEESHPDLFWYGIHGVEILFAVLGIGCRSVSRTRREGTDIVVGTWEGDRMGTFRGIRAGRRGYGGTAFGSEEILTLGPYEGYGGLMTDILQFFRTGVAPVSLEETLEVYAFMEGADESTRRGGEQVSLDEVISNAQPT
ncbi:MAG: Gfo/Idh/MocA family oxidoreductase [Balneolaceae bacterium]